MPSTATTSPRCSWRPRRSSDSPLTVTTPEKRTSFTCAPVGTASTSLSSWPSRMVSSPGRMWIVRTTTSLPSGRLEDVAGAHDPGAQDGRSHGELPVALPVDGLEHRGVPADPARLGAGDHDAPRHGEAEAQSHGAELRLAPP